MRYPDGCVLYPALALSICLVAFTGCARSPGPLAPNQSPLPEPEHSWKLFWSDEFDGDSIDAANWRLSLDCSGGGNNQAECFTDRPENAFVDGEGILHLVAREEEFSGPAKGPLSADYDPEDRSVTRSYTSASLRSRNLFDFRYGRVEIRAQLPAGQGMWPSIWMLPTDEVYGGWPRSGEIDIMESVNIGTGKGREFTSGALNYGLLYPMWSSINTEYETEADLAGDFNIYMIEWEADEIRWFFNGIHFQTQTSKGWYNYLWAGQDKGFEVPNPRAPFDQEFYLILQSTIGGDWPGPPDTGWPADREYLVDYVRVYQCNSGNADGSGCANASDARIDPALAVNPDGGGPKVKRFSLFDDGPGTLALGTTGDKLEKSLVVDRREAAAGNVALGMPDIGGERGRVLEVSFKGPGNVFLASQDPGEMQNIDDGISLVGGMGWQYYGTLEFDLFVESIDAGTSLVASMDSGSPDPGQVAIEIPPVGEWRRVAIRVSDLLAIRISDLLENPGEAGNVRILSPLVIEAAGTSKAKIRLDNIALTCVVNEYARVWQVGADCLIEPVYLSRAVTGSTEIFAGQVGDWLPGDCCGGARAEIVADDVEPDRGNVIEFVYESNETVTQLYSRQPLDFSAVAGGTLSFDLLIVQAPDRPAAQDPWKMKVGCVHPCSTGDIPLTESVEGRAPRIGTWQRFTFAIDDLVARGLKLESLDAPLVIFPSWGNQKGAIFRIDNLVVRAAD